MKRRKVSFEDIPWDENLKTFNFVESLTWTVILANYTSGPTESKEVKQMNGNLPQFCFEIEFFSKKDPRFLLVYRLPVHYEDSEDVLDDGRCVKVSLNEVKRFLDDDQVRKSAP